MDGIFIGKGIKDRQWVEGYYGRYRNIQNIVYTAITQFNEEYGDIYSDGTVAVIPETVGEYVGLHDKKGKRIFTGHIVLSKNGTPCEVVLKDFEYIMVTKYRELKHRLEEYDEGKFEVIGNIFDNPELLENK